MNSRELGAGFISIPIRLPASENGAYQLHRSGVESLGVRTGLAPGISHRLPLGAHHGASLAERSPGVVDIAEG